MYAWNYAACHSDGARKSRAFNAIYHPTRPDGAAQSAMGVSGSDPPEPGGFRPRQVFSCHTCRGGSLPSKPSLREGSVPTFGGNRNVQRGSVSL